MAEQVMDQGAERKRIKEEKKRLKEEQKRARKEAKTRAKELARQESEIEDDTEGSSVSVVVVTTIIILIWLAILVLLIKTDVGGFGSGVLAPILKDVPVLNRILPAQTDTETDDENEYMGYKSLKEAVEQIKSLELQLEQANSGSTASEEEVANLRAEIERLKTFENNQVEFQRIKNEFYEEVVYSDKGPGAEEYRKYYEEMDPTTAEYLYKEVVKGDEADAKVKDYAQAYSEMKPKEAAAIFEAMTDDLALAAKILNTMEPDARGKILGVMNAEVAAKLTKIMNPES